MQFLCLIYKGHVFPNTINFIMIDRLGKFSIHQSGQTNTETDKQTDIAPPDLY